MWITGTLVGLRRVCGYATDLSGVGFGDSGRVDELFAVPLSAVELQADPLNEIESAGAGTAGRGFSVGVTHEPVHWLAVEEHLHPALVVAANNPTPLPNR